ncbi:MAG: DUF935 family protein [Pleurocapsa sp. SU_196_0]|nr:DUF935 family protein [Pleurocapsa sp. SU_196_0]
MPILDQYGDPISTKPPPARAGGSVSMRQASFQYPISGLTPQKLVGILREADGGYLDRQAELFAEMEERDGHLLSQLEIRRLALAGLEWRVVPADDGTQARRIADAFSDWWENANQSDVILDCADAISQGVNITAMAWERSAGTWVPARFEQIRPSDLVFDRTSRRFKVMTADAPLGEYLPFGGGIEHRARARAGSPTRAGLGRTIAWWYLFKHYGIKDWLVFAELFGVPYRVGKYDPSTGNAEREALEAAVRGLGSDAAGVISRDTESRSSKPPSRAARTCSTTHRAVVTARSARQCWVRRVTSSEGAHGTQRLARCISACAWTSATATPSACAPTLRRDLAQPFAVFNFGEPAFNLAPRIVPILEEPEDLGEKAKTLKALHELGLEIPEDWVRETFGIPPVKAGGRVLSRGAAESSVAALESIWGARKPRRVNLEREVHPAAPGVLNGQMFASEVMDAATRAGETAYSTPSSASRRSPRTRAASMTCARTC